MKNLNMKKNQGFGLIDVIGALAIFALVVSGVYALIAKGNESATVKNIADDFRLLDRMIIETRGPGSINMAGIALAEVVASDKNRKLTRDDGLGGFDMFIADNFEVTSIAAATSLSSNDSYAATIGGFDDQQCSDAVRSLWPLLNQVSINGTSVKANSSVQIDGTVSTAISTNCAELETNGLANELVLTKRTNG